ncbi:uncharacterized protein KQ657_002080 [Scheffersomyces spartinae]|uniref:Uncharacterized protein n=1 Tax=Scheffersomyces spartinae TaxID=45513 RepID=A0A9P7VDX3_9ASCO|nr:uncharacterized protein KQ657_002080 [Scheffersomyces spartinae]KAG7195698.1 hypothetical protein KQ657_002080 [Scheffersomyces spartinae]
MTVKEQQRGNQNITPEQLNKLSLFAQKLSTPPQHIRKFQRLPKPKFSPLYTKLQVSSVQTSESCLLSKGKRVSTVVPASRFKHLERVVVAVLESLGNLLDNLHLILHMPYFPKILQRVLTHTNKLWVVILVFLIRKTITQLLNVLRRERKVETELKLVGKIDDTRLGARYEKVLKDLRFDKSMLYIELVGNFMDLSFNLLELYKVAVPDWCMTILNMGSMFMTIYRMNKDDEYVDDDITEDLL